MSLATPPHLHSGAQCAPVYLIHRIHNPGQYWNHQGNHTGQELSIPLMKVLDWTEMSGILSLSFFFGWRVFLNSSSMQRLEMQKFFTIQDKFNGTDHIYLL